MHLIRAPFGDLDVEDSRIVLVDRDSGELRIKFDSGTLKSANGARRKLGEFVLVLSGLCSEEVVSDFGSTSGKPDLDYPIDIVEVVEFEPGCLTLQGYRGNVPWHAWTIRHKQIAIECGRGAQEHAT